MAEDKSIIQAILAGGFGVITGATIATLLAARPAKAAPSEEKLDYLIASQEVVVSLLHEIRTGIGQLLEKEEVPMEITKQVPLAYNVAALEVIKLAEPSPLRGRITSVTMHFPDGCDGLVHIAFGHGEVWLCPSEPNTYISLNDATPTFPTSEPVEKGEHLWAEFRNATAFPHNVSVIVTITGTEE